MLYIKFLQKQLPEASVPAPDEGLISMVKPHMDPSPYVEQANTGRQFDIKKKILLECLHARRIARVDGNCPAAHLTERPAWQLVRGCRYLPLENSRHDFANLFRKPHLYRLSPLTHQIHIGLQDDHPGGDDGRVDHIAHQFPATDKTARQILGVGHSKGAARLAANRELGGALASVLKLPSHIFHFFLSNLGLHPFRKDLALIKGF